MAGPEDYKASIMYDFTKKSVDFHEKDHDRDEEEKLQRKCMAISTDEWYDGSMHDEMDTGSIPHNNLTHLILSDDIKLLNEKIDERLPIGMIIIHGGPYTTKLFCEAVQKGDPVFIFK